MSRGLPRQLLSGAGVLALVSFGWWRSAPRTEPAPSIRANDNRTPAGHLHGDTLVLRLVVRPGRWRPEPGRSQPIEVAAFAEEGKLPQIPGPLIRVRTGTVIDATLRNGLPDSALTFFGFANHPASLADSLALRPGESRRIRFAAGAPGTYLYAAVAGKHDFDKDDERETSAGALIVDPLEGSPPDRVFVVNIWGHTIDSTTYPNALAINGYSWPATERIEALAGDTLRWRIVNASGRPHPMHLHGFYYQVRAAGDGLVDTLYEPEARRMVVTESMAPFSTRSLAWVAERPGNWLFHCHIGFHVVPEEATLQPADTAGHDRMSDDPGRHMAGLVLGISVRARPGWSAPARGEPRRLRLFIQEGPRRGHARRALGFVLQEGAPPAGDSVRIPGSVLFLTRGQPTDIVVLNRLRETAAVHWHGIELESWSDGVVGWSGLARRVVPSIQPGDSFVAHLSLPRAGTFIYHTHMNDIEQLTSGLYGAIVVLEPGQRFDPPRDHLFVAGWDGTQDLPQLLLNGDSLPPALVLSAGTRQRLRFINIGAANRPVFALLRDSSAMSWRALAKDGAELPPAQATLRPARQQIDVGETYDFEWIPEVGTYRLVVSNPKQLLREQRIVVRP